MLGLSKYNKVDMYVSIRPTSCTQQKNGLAIMIAFRPRKDMISISISKQATSPIALIVATVMPAGLDRVGFRAKRDLDISTHTAFCQM